MSKKITRICPSCGARIKKYDERCPYCGAVNALASEASYVKGLNKEIKRIDNLSTERNKDFLSSLMHYVRIVGFTMLAVAIVILIIAIVAKTIDHHNLITMRETLINGMH